MGLILTLENKLRECSGELRVYVRQSRRVLLTKPKDFFVSYLTPRPIWTKRQCLAIFDRAASFSLGDARRRSVSAGLRSSVTAAA